MTDQTSDADRRRGRGHGHSHALDISDVEKNGRRLFIAAVLIGGFMLVEVVGGLISGSLALLADAGHMLSDFASLVLAWYAFHASKQPATVTFSYGKDRLQVIAAFVNALTMFFICIWITVEAIGRLIHPVEVLSGTMMAIAAVGLAVNVAAYVTLSGADRNNLNVRGAMMHVMGDLLGSVAAIAAAGIIMATGWTVVDPLLSLLVVVIIARGAYPVLLQSGHILLEGTPTDLDVDEIKDDLIKNVSAVNVIHHFHLWSLTQARPMATLHASVAEDADVSDVIRAIKGRIARQFGIEHATVEIEFGECADFDRDCHDSVESTGQSQQERKSRIS